MRDQDCRPRSRATAQAVALLAGAALACGKPQPHTPPPPAIDAPCVPGQYCVGIFACRTDAQCVLTVGLCDEQDCINGRHLLDYRAWLNQMRPTIDCRKRGSAKGNAAPCWCDHGRCSHRG